LQSSGLGNNYTAYLTLDGCSTSFFIVDMSTKHVFISSMARSLNFHIFSYLRPIQKYTNNLSRLEPFNI